MITVNIIRKLLSLVPLDRKQWEERGLKSDIPTQNADQKLFTRRPDKLKQSDILHNNWPIVLKSAKVMKVKGRLKSRFILKEAKETSEPCGVLPKGLRKAFIKKKKLLGQLVKFCWSLRIDDSNLPVLIS